MTIGPTLTSSFRLIFEISQPVRNGGSSLVHTTNESDEFMGSYSEIGFWKVTKQNIHSCSGEAHGRNEFTATTQVPLHQADAGRCPRLRTIDELFDRFRVEPEFAGNGA